MPDSSSPQPPDEPTRDMAVANRFRQLRPTRRLAILGMGGEIGMSPAIGKTVRAGEALIDDVPAGLAMPIAPVAGAIAGVGWGCAIGGRAGKTILFDPAPKEEAGQPIPFAKGDETIPRDRDGLGAAIDRLRTGGVWADRWTCPDLLAQLHYCLRRPIDTAICGAIDLDPSAPLQWAIAQQWPEELAVGASLLGEWCATRQTWIVIPAAGDSPTVAALREHTAHNDSRLVALREEYPQSNPTILIHQLTGRRLPPSELPVSAGILIFDAAAAVAVGRLMLRGEPMTHVPMAVYDVEQDRTTFALAPVGMELGHVIEQVGILPGQPLLRASHPLRQIAVDAQAVTGGAELVICASSHEAAVNPDPCIRCAWCVEACPVRITPAGLLEAAQRHDLALARSYGLAACIDCGICSYVCPSRLPLLPGIRILRTMQEA
ncbi:MAG TPA: 4Fe-4S dicluster domain-containing protein [Tepidisphaeraceae bacterium]|nr:4Fe-4S dicluster domain-containing protein [Tepidisphaeraceae bacterium]